MKKLVGLVLVASLLGGCQSIFGDRAKLEVRPVGVGQTPAASAIALEEGKQHLRTGALGAAIASLQVAANDEATMAEAHNALAVAYASLGRGDLAERFFRQAIAENPAEAKYSANLSLFYQSREAAMARLQAPAPAPLAAAVELAEEAAIASAASPPEKVVQAGPGVIRISLPTPAGSMTRVSAQEVSIRTVREAPAAVMADGRRRNPKFVAVAPAGRPAAYPLRVRLDPRDAR